MHNIIKIQIPILLEVLNLYSWLSLFTWAQWLDWISDSSTSIHHSEWKKSLSRVWLFATAWTVAYKAPLSMEFSRQEYWSGLPFPSLFFLLHIAGRHYRLSHQGKAFPGGSAGNESTCNERNLGSIPGLGRSPGEGKGYPLQYSS